MTSDANMKIYAFGSNNFRQLDGCDNRSILSPTLVYWSNRITPYQCTCSILSTWENVFHYSQKHCYIYGFSGKLHNSNDLSEVTKSFPVIRSIASSANNVYILEEAGILRSWKSKCFEESGFVIDLLPFNNEDQPISVSACDSKAIVTFSSGAVHEVLTIYQKHPDKINDTQSMTNKDDSKENIVNNSSLEYDFLCQEINLSVKIKTVSCGKEHVLMLSGIGTVFSYGTGSRGQCGHGDISNQDKPRALEALEGVQMECIAAGGWHSVCVSDIGDVYVWGWNESGQLGLPCKGLQEERASMAEGTVNIQQIPRVLDIVINDKAVDVIQAACGSRHTAFVTDTAQLLTSGWNHFGQLGLGDRISRDCPTLVKFFGEVVDVTCGPWNTIVTTKPV